MVGGWELTTNSPMNAHHVVLAHRPCPPLQPQLDKIRTDHQLRRPMGKAQAALHFGSNFLDHAFFLWCVFRGRRLCLPIREGCHIIHGVGEVVDTGRRGCGIILNPDTGSMAADTTHMVTIAVAINLDIIVRQLCLCNQYAGLPRVLRAVRQVCTFYMYAQFGLWICRCLLCVCRRRYMR